MLGGTVDIHLMTGRFETPGETQAAADPMARLVERARCGDSDAFDRLVQSCQNQVLATAWRMLGHREEAQDAAQEVFLKLYRHLDSFQTRSSFTTWLYRITVNVCHDLGRKRRRREAVTVAESEASPALIESVPSGEDVERTVMHRQQQAILARALATLAEKERAALVLRDLQGLTTEEVASILGSRPVTVRAQVRNARAKIREFHRRYVQPPARRASS